MRTKKTFTAEEQRRHHARKREKKAGSNLPALPGRWEPRFLENANGQIGPIRQLKKRFRQLVQDSDAVSYQKQMLCSRAVFLCTLCETYERLAIENGKFDHQQYLQTVNALVSVCKSLGLERARKQATRLESYINAKKVKRS